MFEAEKNKMPVLRKQCQTVET